MLFGVRWVCGDAWCALVGASWLVLFGVRWVCGAAWCALVGASWLVHVGRCDLVGVWCRRERAGGGRRTADGGRRTAAAGPGVQPQNKKTTQ